MRLVETEAYRSLSTHDDEWIARRLGVDVDTARRCIGRMTESGLIELAAGRLRARKPLTIFTGGDRSRVRTLKEHWDVNGRST